MRRYAGALALAGGLALVLNSITGSTASLSDHTTSKLNLQWIVSPHPDDVFQGWSLIQNSPGNYPVFITLTKGEHTKACPEDANTTVFSPANPMADMKMDSQGCKDKRMYYLNRWLDKQANLDSYLDTEASMTSATYSVGTWNGITPNNVNLGGTVAASKLTIRVGNKSARAEFDLGDGDVAVAEVRWAMNAVRAKASQGVFPLPLSSEYGVVGADYDNRLAGCLVYHHPDHYAEHQALYGYDVIPSAGNHPQWGATCRLDDDYTGANGGLPNGRSGMIDGPAYTANMSCPSGHMNTQFGWLAFDGPTSDCWASGFQTDPDHGALFTRDNYFWRAAGT